MNKVSDVDSVIRLDGILNLFVGLRVKLNLTYTTYESILSNVYKYFTNVYNRQW